ncbi:hypothetical protein GOHSU_16_01540 [Gordonia hirsuta DSM 44140 = NBRC 16056]|uniref:PemK-like protein n=1 Tax=Gordonia hirsuta DSM 44140 = NBRC 16056 TaxID=1121927 RepID=L7L8V9_9ACTN|nr:hypothetical protein GOHSU_16_01540 [Gordonia hirsuta DSM 44140 = NBRC 16056]
MSQDYRRPRFATQPSRSLARQLAYSPELDGAADPGEVVWMWVPFEDDPAQGKDRPVLVVGRDRATLLGLMLSSKEYHRDEENWLRLGTGAWDYNGRVSYVRLDRVIVVAEHGIRREGSILNRRSFDRIADQLRAQYGWS